MTAAARLSSLVLLMLAGCKASIDLSAKSERPYRCDRDGGAGCPSTEFCGFDLRCHPLGVRGTYACGADSDCQGGDRCSPEGRCVDPSGEALVSNAPDVSFSSESTLNPSLPWGAVDAVGIGPPFHDPTLLDDAQTLAVASNGTLYLLKGARPGWSDEKGPRVFFKVAKAALTKPVKGLSVFRDFSYVRYDKGFGIFGWQADGGAAGTDIDTPPLHTLRLASDVEVGDGGLPALGLSTSGAFYTVSRLSINGSTNLTGSLPADVADLEADSTWLYASTGDKLYLSDRAADTPSFSEVPLMTLSQTGCDPVTGYRVVQIVPPRSSEGPGLLKLVPSSFPTASPATHAAPFFVTNRCPGIPLAIVAPGAPCAVCPAATPPLDVEPSVSNQSLIIEALCEGTLQGQHVYARYVFGASCTSLLVDAEAYRPFTVDQDVGVSRAFVGPSTLLTSDGAYQDAYSWVLPRAPDVMNEWHPGGSDVLDVLKSGGVTASPDSQRAIAFAQRDLYAELPGFGMVLSGASTRSAMYLSSGDTLAPVSFVRDEPSWLLTNGGFVFDVDQETPKPVVVPAATVGTLLPPFSSQVVSARDGRLLIVVAANDALLMTDVSQVVASFSDSSVPQTPAVIEVRLVPQSKIPIVSMLLGPGAPQADGTSNLIEGYALTRNGLFFVSAADDQRWTSRELPIAGGQWLELWDEDGRGRLGYADGRVYSLPSRVPLVNAELARVQDYERFCGRTFALASDGLYRLEPPQGSDPYGHWGRQTVDALEQLSSLEGARLFVSGARLYVFSAEGVAVRIDAATCP